MFQRAAGENLAELEERHAMSPNEAKPGRVTVGFIVQDGVTIVRLTGWIEHYTGNVLLQEMLAELASRGHRHLVLDLSGARFAVAPDFGVLLYYHDALRKKLGCLVLAAPTESFRRALHAANLGRSLCVCDTLGEALEAAAGEIEGEAGQPG
jgi:anti-anti-sigma factor